MITFKENSFDYFFPFEKGKMLPYYYYYSTEAVTQNEVNTFCNCACTATLLISFTMDCFSKSLVVICLKTLL